MFRSRFRTDFLGLTIAPTSDCNFRCVYCYEKDSVKYPPMSEEVQKKVIEMIRRSIKSIRVLNVMWYGGEPLLCFDIIRSLSRQIMELCQEHGVEYKAGIVTNGYLLTPDICKEFIDLKISNIQITLDGTQEQHDKRRFLKNGEGTYKKIVDNIKAVKGILPYKISLRVNVDRRNIDEAKNFLELIENEGIRDIVVPYLGMVHTSNGCCSENECYTPESFAEIYYDFEFRKANGNVMRRYPAVRSNSCGADMLNSFVIDSDGRLYKCWNDIGIHERAIGSLNAEKGKENSNFEVLKQYMMYDPTMDNTCRDCNVLPICMGGCHMQRIQNSNRCIYMKQYLENFLEKAVDEITAKK